MHSDKPIKSIELQLVRVETCGEYNLLNKAASEAMKCGVCLTLFLCVLLSGCAEGYSKDGKYLLYQKKI